MKATSKLVKGEIAQSHQKKKEGKRETNLVSRWKETGRNPDRYEHHVERNAPKMERTSNISALTGAKGKPIFSDAENIPACERPHQISFWPLAILITCTYIWKWPTRWRTVWYGKSLFQKNDSITSALFSYSNRPFGQRPFIDFMTKCGPFIERKINTIAPRVPTAFARRNKLAFR